MSTNIELDRITRIKERCVIKREGYVGLLRSIHILAKNSIDKPELSHHLLEAVGDLDDLWSKFSIEDDAVLDQLIDLGRASEYSHDLSIEMRTIITFSKSVANRYRSINSGRSNGSVDSAVSPLPEHSKKDIDVPSILNVENSSAIISNHPPIVRLPEIPLPTFNGDIFQWPSFRDRFLAMVDQRPQLSNIDKIHYLMGCIKGAAADAVRGIPLSGDTYKLIWSTLVSRFDKPRLIAGSVVETLLKAGMLTSESLSELHKFMVAFDESISVLDSLKIPNLGDFILFSLASRCLPLSSRTLFEAQVVSDYPTVSELFAFVKERIAILERAQDSHTLCGGTRATGQSARSMYNSRPPPKGFPRRDKLSPTTLVAAGQSSSALNCKCCKGHHALTACFKFTAWSSNTRVAWVREHRLCFRCLGEGHWSPKCRSSVVCSQCQRKHHTLVHTDGPSATTRNEEGLSDGQPKVVSTSSLVGHLACQSVLLGTALVHIRDCGGALHSVRALIDSASQISAITSNCATRLGLRLSRWTAPVSGLSGVSVVNVKGKVECHVQPRFSPDPVIPFTAWVFPSITADMPRQQVSREVTDRYRTLALADPSFSSPAAIDLLLGADIFSQIMDGKRVTMGDSLPVAFGSVFGWIIIGPVPESAALSFHTCPISLTTSVESLMKKFWTIEEPDVAPEEFTTDGQCEKLFREGCARSEYGRFTVPLPFRHSVSADVFRGSREVALRRFDHLERKLAADPRLRELYCDFMSEYLSLGHMSPASSPGIYFIPHHAIYRPSDTDPKFRVVFDASAKSFTGSSLNSCLLSGPKLQRDVVDVLLLFRLSRYAFTADICKMYRQILIAPEQRSYQHILWRASPHDELKSYELNTVTYGVNCAPFLAIRVLRYIAEHDCSDFPRVKQALLLHTYVDDICIGADTECEARELQSQLITVLGRAGLQLRKWSSNSTTVLEQVPPEDRAKRSLPFEDGDGEGVKVLGLRWSPEEDSFHYFIQPEPIVATKRGMLSLISRIFDPLGLLAPVVFLAKHFMQRVWQAETAWDEPLPSGIAASWRQLVSELPALQQLRIKRCVALRRDVRVTLCGFCDASERGYAAVVYLRVEEPPGCISVSLLGTKTKLAPINTLTIPRLELCAAVLLARWMSRIHSTLRVSVDITQMYAWSDSAIVLSWLSVRHETFKIFVSNRIHQIHTLLPGCHWNHVSSVDNPADCASRGLLPTELVTNELYRWGPKMLSSPVTQWDTSISYVPLSQLPEVKHIDPTVLILEDEPEWFARFSSFVLMIRVVARMRRFITRCRRRTWPETYLTRHELDEATLILVRSSQHYSFNKLRNELLTSSLVSARPVARLRPFIDARDVICVGGRLSNSELSDGRKHPILLAKSSHLSLLLVRHWHDITGHSGPRVMMALIGRQYWVLSLRGLIRSVIAHCNVCVRISAVNPQPIMADLPKSRVSECRPFSRVGIDYAGPLSMKEHRLRKARHYKVYLAVFVCFAVKAVHLEVVTDLTTDAFIAALQRFVARRGLPTDIYTDCGTNFVGAANKFRDLLHDPAQRDRIVAATQFTWHFNPPAAPHFGGLWEAAVRSTKSLLGRIMGEHTLTLEELGTVLCRVEAILNSRPLTPASTDPAELDCLTPGHFLIGQPLLAVPEADIVDSPRPLVNRWKLVNQCVQSFWRRWRDEYLQTLQTRTRWMSNDRNLIIDDMVIIKDPHSPPLQWRIARVIGVSPGADGVVRVVRLRTSDGIIIRPVVKLVKLPTAE